MGFLVISGKVNLLCTGEVNFFLLGFRAVHTASKAVDIGQICLRVFHRTVNGLDGKEGILRIISALGDNLFVAVKGIFAAAFVAGYHAKLQQGFGRKVRIRRSAPERAESSDGILVVLQGHISTTKLVHGLPIERGRCTCKLCIFQEVHLAVVITQKAAGNAGVISGIQVIRVRVLGHLKLIGIDGGGIISAEEIAVCHSCLGIGPHCP